MKYQVHQLAVKEDTAQMKPFCVSTTKCVSAATSAVILPTAGRNSWRRSRMNYGPGTSPSSEDRSPGSSSTSTDVALTFSKSFSGEVNDIFGVGVSTDGSTYTGVQAQGGGDGGWSTVGQSLTAYAGSPQVWFAFVFLSQPNSTNPENKPGPFLDDVQLYVKYTKKTFMPFVAYGDTPTPLLPMPTPTGGCPRSCVNARFRE